MLHTTLMRRLPEKSSRSMGEETASGAAAAASDFCEGMLCLQKERLFGDCWALEVSKWGSWENDQILRDAEV